MKLNKKLELGISAVQALKQRGKPTRTVDLATEIGTTLHISNVTVFLAKKVVTMDPAIPSATAIAVADGRILSVGTLGTCRHISCANDNNFARLCPLLYRLGLGFCRWL